VTAASVLRERGTATEEDLIKHCGTALTGYETPNVVLF
jgi:hypothetical protein